MSIDMYIKCVNIYIWNSYFIKCDIIHNKIQLNEEHFKLIDENLIVKWLANKSVIYWAPLYLALIFYNWPTTSEVKQSTSKSHYKLAIKILKSTQMFYAVGYDRW